MKILPAFLAFSLLACQPKDQKKPATETTPDPAAQREEIADLLNRKMELQNALTQLQTQLPPEAQDAATQLQNDFFKATTTLQETIKNHPELLKLNQKIDEVQTALKLSRRTNREFDRDHAQATLLELQTQLALKSKELPEIQAAQAAHDQAQQAITQHQAQSLVDTPEGQKILREISEINTTLQSLQN